MRQTESEYEAKDSNAQRILFIGAFCLRCGVSAAEQPSGGRRRVQISHSHFSSVLCRFAGREHIILNNCRCKAKVASQGQTVRCGQAEFKTIGYVILNGVKKLKTQGFFIVLRVTPERKALPVVGGCNGGWVCVRTKPVQLKLT